MGYIEIIRPVRTAVARGPGARPRRDPRGGPRERRIDLELARALARARELAVSSRVSAVETMEHIRRLIARGGLS